MANNTQNGFPVGYNYNYNMLNNPQPTAYANPQPRPINVQWVQGMASAKSYMMEPNSMMALWDSEDTKIYLKTTDQYGRVVDFKVLSYTIENVVENGVDMANYVTREQFDNLMREVSDVKSLIQSNAARPISAEPYTTNMGPVHSEPAPVPSQPQYTDPAAIR